MYLISDIRDVSSSSTAFQHSVLYYYVKIYVTAKISNTESAIARRERILNPLELKRIIFPQQPA
jgi:hypothetical protein